MGYPDRSFLMAREAPPPAQQEPAVALSGTPKSIWENEHMHAAITSSALLGLGVVTWWAGLRIAPVACFIFASTLVIADLRSRFKAGDAGAQISR
jgi:hypothetical protein